MAIFMGFYVNCFLSISLRFTNMGLQRSTLKDPPKENDHKFTPLMAPIASKFRLGNFLFMIFLEDTFVPRACQRLPISANLPY